VLWCWVACGKRKPVENRWAWLALANGCLIGLHWHLFFLATRLGTISVALTGLATMALWVSLLEPLLVKERRLHLRESLLALAVSGGVALIAVQDDVELPALLTGVAAAAAWALFAIFNARLLTHLTPVRLSAYSMTSAAVFCTLLSLLTLRPFTAESWLPRAADWAPLLALALICTVIVFSVCLWLQKRMSAFTIGLASNLEPVYGMLFAAAIWPEQEVMSVKFYAGAALIIVCVLVHSLSMRRAAP
jgi:drug/metabolite transporter (DMT)-like permease